jgi:prepilin-type N-terminal cleavage/methylation domain-containing protein
LRKKCNTESAFTLLELLVVCALISILLAIAVPTLRNSLLTDPLKTASRQIIGLVKEVREQAIREQAAYVIHFDFTENSIRVEKESEQGLVDPEKVKEDTLHLPEPVRFLDVWTTSEGKLDTGQPTLWVSKQGYMDQAIVHLGTDGDAVISLLFSPFLGTVRVTDGYMELN